MTVTLDLPEEALQRLRDEAARRGVTLEAVIAELSAHLPAHPRGKGRRLSFIGLGASGRTESFDIHRERTDLADRRLDADL